MTAPTTCVFVTDAGIEISVRTTEYNPSTATPTLEPLYAADLKLLDGVTGELHGRTGEGLRGTLRRQGDVFALYPEQPREKVQEQREAPQQAATSMSAPRTELAAKGSERVETTPQSAVSTSVPHTEPQEQAQETAPSPAVAFDAALRVAQFLRGERGVSSLEAAKDAQSIVIQFIAKSRP